MRARLMEIAFERVRVSTYVDVWLCFFKCFCKIILEPLEIAP